MFSQSGRSVNYFSSSRAEQELRVRLAACGGKQDPLHEHSCFFACLQDEGRMREEWRLKRALIEHFVMRVMERQVPPAMQDQSGNGRGKPRCYLATNASIP